MHTSIDADLQTKEKDPSDRETRSLYEFRGVIEACVEWLEDLSEEDKETEAIKKVIFKIITLKSRTQFII